MIYKPTMRGSLSRGGLKVPMDKDSSESKDMVKQEKCEGLGWQSRCRSQPRHAPWGFEAPE